MSKKTKQDVFERAIAAAHDGDSAAIAGVVRELAALLEETRAEWEATRPPGQTMHYTGTGAGYLAPVEPGQEWRRVADTDDAEALARLEARHRTLGDRRDRATWLRKQLQQRGKVAGEAERRAAAPAEARRLLETLPEHLDRVDAALEELAAAMEARDDTLRQLDATRALAGGEPYYEPATLRRIWVQDGDPVDGGLLTTHLLQRRISGRAEPLNVCAPGHGGHMQLLNRYYADVLKRLAPPRASLLARLAKLWGDHPTIAAGTLREVNTERAKIIARGTVAELDQEDRLAEQTVRSAQRVPADRQFSPR